MLKFVVVLALALGANGSLLPLPLLPTVSPVDLIAEVEKVLKDFQQKLSDGVVVKPPGFDKAIATPLITFPGGLVLNAGIVALPTPFLCNQPSGIISKLVCRTGASDCTYVHNTYSGKCGNSSNPVPGTTQEDGQVFICNDVNPTDYNFVNLSDVHQCGVLLGTVLDAAFDLAIQNFLRTRLTADLCPQISGSLSGSLGYDSVGCNSDCRNNHQYASGVCVSNATPTAVFPGELHAEFQCLCSL